MNFFSMHGHTTYSFLDGYGRPEQIAERLKSLGQTGAACTDHGNTFAFVPFEIAMRKAGLKPIFGLEAYVVDDMSERTKFNPSLGADGFPHATIIAMTQEGYANLLKLCTLSWKEGYYYKPRLDWETIAKYQKGLIVLSGCVGGYPSRIINSGKHEEARNFVATRRQQIEHYYVELVPEPGLSISHTSTPVLMQIARELSVPMIMTHDGHFPSPEDHDTEDNMLCIGIRTEKNDPQRQLKLPAFQYYCSAEELLDRAVRTLTGQKYEMSELVQAIENSAILADLCEVEIPKAKPMLFPGIANSEEQLWSDIVAGMRKRMAQGRFTIQQLQQYKERAEMEYSKIKAKNFCDYLLVVADVCNAAKNNGGLVMCRGSAGGCLLLFLLGCSETDPIVHKLSFQRFYDDSREDAPDVDMDFESNQRDWVIQYITDKYGKANTAQIAALTVFRAKNALLDLAKIYGIDRAEIQDLASALDSKDDDTEKQFNALTDPAAKAILQKYPQLAGINEMIGQCRQSSIHAAGMLISSAPINDCIAIIEQPGKPRIASADKKNVAAIGFLKLDLLSVMALDIVSAAVKRIGKTNEWLYSLPLDDTEVYKHARNGKVAGVFQLDGSAMKIGYKIGLETFQEFYACSALCRPGANSHVNLYAENKHNPGKFASYLSKLHPIAAKIVEETNGVLLYQEQVMAICHDMAMMDWPIVNRLRKRISSATSEFYELGGEYKDAFFTGCLTNGVSEEETATWWNAIKAHGFYSFNKSHCVTYGIIGYWMLYLSHYYPDAYYESFLRFEGHGSTNELLMKRLVLEYVSRGGKFELISPKYSQKSFHSPYPGLIVGGWENIKGIGSVQADGILKAGPFENWSDVKRKVKTDIYYRFHEAGLTGALPIDRQACIELCPWMPVYTSKPAHTEARELSGAWQPSDLTPGEAIDGDVLICGYVTVAHRKLRAGQFKGDQIIYMAEDEHGAIEFRASQKNVAMAQRLKIEVAKADYIAVSGWWSGDALYVKDFQVIDRRE